MLYSSVARGKVVMCDPVCEHRFHTVYFILSKDDISYWTTPSFVEALTLRQLSMAATILVTANIRATTTRYRKVRRTPITLRHAIVRQLCYPSSSNPHFLFGAIFFNWGSTRRTLAIIQ